MAKVRIAEFSVDLKKAFDGLRNQLNSLDKTSKVTFSNIEKAFKEMKSSIQNIDPKYSKKAFIDLAKRYNELLSSVQLYETQVKKLGLSSEQLNAIMGKGSEESVGKYVERLKIFLDEYNKANALLQTNKEKIAMAANKVLASQKIALKAPKAEEAITFFKLIVDAADGSMEQVRALMSEFPNDMKKAFLDKSGMTEKMRDYWAKALGVPTDENIAKAKVMFKKLTDTKIRAMQTSFEATKLMYMGTTGVKEEPKAVQETSRRFTKESKQYTDGLANLEKMKAELSKLSMSRDRKEYDAKVALIKVEESALEKSLGRLTVLNKSRNERLQKDIEIVEKGKILSDLGYKQINIAKTLSGLRESDSKVAQVEIDRINNLIKLQKKLNDYNAKEQQISNTLINSLDAKRALMLEELRIRQNLSKVSLIDKASLDSLDAQFKVAANKVKQIMTQIGRITIKRDIAVTAGDPEQAKKYEAQLLRANTTLNTRKGILNAIHNQGNAQIKLQDQVVQRNQRLVELGMKAVNISGMNKEAQKWFLVNADTKIKAAEELEKIEARLLALQVSRVSGRTLKADSTKVALTKENLSIEEKLAVVDEKLNARKTFRNKLTKNEKVQLKAISKLKTELLRKEDKLAVAEKRKLSALGKIHAKHKGIMKLMGQRIRFILTAGLAYKAQGAFISMYKDSIKERLKLEKEIAEVGTLQTEGLQASLAIMEKFKKAILGLSEKYGEDTSKLTKALYDIRSATIPTYKALGVLEVVTRAGKASLTDAASAAKPIIAILNAYKMEAEEAGYVSDMLFATIQRGVTTMKELGPNIGKAIAAAAMVGVEAPQVLAMVSSTTRMGVSTRETITAINRLMLNFSKQTKAATDIAIKYGFTLDSIKDSKTGLVELFNKMKNATDQEKIALVGSVRAFKAMAAGVIDAQGQMFDLSYITDSVGKTQEAMDKIENTVSFKTEQIKQQLHVALIKFGDLLMPLFTKVIDAFDEMKSSGMIEWFKKLTRTVTFALGVFAGWEILNVITKGLLALNTAINVVTISTEALTAAMGWVKLVAIAASIAFGIYMQHMAKRQFAELEREKLLKERANRMKNERLATLEEISLNKERIRQLNQEISAYKDLNSIVGKTETEQKALDKMYQSIVKSSREVGIETKNYDDKLKSLNETSENTISILKKLSKLELSLKMESLKEEIESIEYVRPQELQENLYKDYLEKTTKGHEILAKIVDNGDKTLKQKMQEAVKLIESSNLKTDVLVEEWFGEAHSALADYIHYQGDKESTIVLQAAYDKLNAVIDRERIVPTRQATEIVSKLRDSSKDDITKFYELLKEELEGTADTSGRIIKLQQDRQSGLITKQQASQEREVNKLLKEILDEYEKGFNKEQSYKRMQELFSKLDAIPEDTPKVSGEDLTAEERAKKLTEAYNRFLNNVDAKFEVDKQKLQENFIKETDFFNIKGDVEIGLEKITIDTKDTEIKSIMEQYFKRIKGTKTDVIFDLEGESLEKFLIGYKDLLLTLEKEKQLKIDKQNIIYDEKKYQEQSALTEENIRTTNKLLINELNTRKILAELKGEEFNLSIEQKLIDKKIEKYELQLKELNLKKQIEEADRQITTAIVIDDEEARVHFAKERAKLIEEIVEIQAKLNDLTDAEIIALRMKLKEENRIMLTLDEILILTEKITQAEKRAEVSKQQTTIANLRKVDEKKEYLRQMSPEHIISTLAIDKKAKESGELSEDEGLTKDEKSDLKKELNTRSAYAMIGINARQSEADIRVDIENKANELINQGIEWLLNQELVAIEKKKEAQLKAIEDTLQADKDHVAGTLLTAGHKAKVFAAMEKKAAEDKAKIEENAEKARQKAEKKKAQISIMIDTARAIVATFASLGFAAGWPFALAMAAIGATQLAIVNNAKYAEGGHTGYGFGQRDETGKRQAGIVHEREFVMKEAATNGNVGLFYAMQRELANGKSFASFATDYLTGSLRYGILPSPTTSFAEGGYASTALNSGVSNDVLESLMSQQNYLMNQMNERLNTIEYYNSETSDNTNRLRKQRNRY